MLRSLLAQLILLVCLCLAGTTAAAHGMEMAAKVLVRTGGGVAVSLYDANGAPVSGADVRLNPGGKLAAAADGYTGTLSLPSTGQVKLEVRYGDEQWNSLLELKDGALVRPSEAVLLTPAESTLDHGGWVWLLVPALVVVAAGAWTLRGRRPPAGTAATRMLALALLLTATTTLAGCGAKKPEGLDVVTRVSGQQVEVTVTTTNKWAIGKDGHAHLYLDGNPAPVTIMEARYTYPKLAPGKHSIRVELTGHDHKPLGVEKTVTVEVD